MVAIYQGLKCDWCGKTEDFTFIVQSVQGMGVKVARPLQSPNDKTEQVCFFCLESAYFTVFEHVAYDSEYMAPAIQQPKNEPDHVVHWEVNGLKKVDSLPNRPQLRLV